MNNALVYMQEDQVRIAFQNFKSLGSSLTPSIAFGFDNGDVFHVYTTAPKTSLSGYPCPSIIHFVDQIPNNENAINLARELRNNRLVNWTKSSHSIIIILAIFNEQLIHRVFVSDQGGQISEGTIKFIPGHSELYSRSKGIIESAILENSKVGIVGLGSGGSAIAVELAKAGVGNFILIDFDRLELSNVARHICSVGDLGRYKTKAVADIIYGKNPYVTIKTAEIDINENLGETNLLLLDCDLIIAATDNNRSRFNLNSIALEYNITTIFGRALTRAVGGDVLRVRPHVGPCLGCLFTKGFLKNRDEEVSQFRQARSDNPAYVSDEQVVATIQVGLSSDIAPISNMIVKLALVELSKGKPSGISSLEEDLMADFYIWANRRELTYSSWPKMEYGSKTPSILRWYGAKCDRAADCPACGQSTQNDLQDDFFG